MKYIRVWPVLFLLLGLGGCFSIKERETLSLPAPDISKAHNIAGQKLQNFQEKKENAAQLPAVLGGVISSERWVIYKDKEQEEFEGDVSYDNGTYLFRAQYALSDRKKNLFTAKKQVYARKNETDKSYYELYADKATYQYSTADGTATANKGKRIKLIYHDAKGALVTALAQKADFNVKQKVYHLTGNVLVTHQDPLGKVSTLKADKISADQANNRAFLQGNAVVENADYRLQSQTIEYDGTQQMAYAYGNRPLASGKTPDGTFAIIADKVSAQTDTRKIKLSGQVQGWVVSEQINNSKANESLNTNF